MPAVRLQYSAAQALSVPGPPTLANGAPANPAGTGASETSRGH